MTILDYRSRVLFYLPLLMVLMMLYRNSWLPFGGKLAGKEVYVVAFTFATLSIMVFSFFHFAQQDLSYHTHKNFVILALFVALSISTLAFNLQEITFSSYYLARFISFIAYFFIYVIYFPRFLIQNRDYFRKFILFTTLLGSVTGFLGLMFLFLGLNPPGEYSGLAVSYIVHPNYTAYIYTVSIFATIYFYYTGTFSFNDKVFIIAGLFFQVLGMVLTNCRAAMLGVTVGVSIFFFVKYKLKLILFIPLFSAIVFFLGKKIYALKGSVTAVSRAFLFMAAIEMITQSWNRFLWGYGLTDNLFVYKDYMAKSDILENINSPHNAVLSLMIMCGAVFTFLFVSYLSYILGKTLITSLRKIDEKEKMFHAFLFSSMLALIIYTLFDSQIVMLEFFSLQYFLIYFGILLCYNRRKKLIPFRNIWYDMQLR